MMLLDCAFDNKESNVISHETPFRPLFPRQLTILYSPFSLYFSGSTVDDSELSCGAYPSHPKMDVLGKAAATTATGEADASGHHYSSLQCVHCSHSTHLTTTDSGSICIKDSTAVSKLLSKLSPLGYPANCQILNFDEGTKIALEYNSLQQQLILRHISGDSVRYKNLCRELISTII